MSELDRETIDHQEKVIARQEKQYEMMKKRAEEAERTVASLATMLGWANIPPQATIEMSLSALKKRLEIVEAELKGASPEWKDHNIEEDVKIRAVHPLHTGDHVTYLDAMRFVGSKRSKYALVDLVNWLLVRIKKLEDKIR